MYTSLPREFYDRSALEVAQELLGHCLVRRIGDELCGGLVVETEAYLAEDDPSMWAYQRETGRNRTLFQTTGHFYIYRVYRQHALLNVSCRERGVAEAVLVRAIEPTFGESVMRQYRRVERTQDLTSGPSKLCVALNVDTHLSDGDACDGGGALFYAANPQREREMAERSPLITTTRIGLSRGGDLPLRFYLGGSKWVSKRIPRYEAPHFTAELKAAEEDAPSLFT